MFSRASMCLTNEYTCSLDIDGKLWAFGNIITDGKKSIRICTFIPKHIELLEPIKTIACGRGHTICVTISGDTFSFGFNSSDQLGLGNSFHRRTFIPQKLNIPPVQQVSCGNDYTICLTMENEVYCFGRGSLGQLGLGNTSTCYVPTKNPYLSNIEFVECGGYHSFCKTFHGEYYYWGSCSYGQLGQGDFKFCSKASKCNWEENFISVKCGFAHTLGLTENGSVYSFGGNEYGQLGNSNKKNCIIPTKIQNLPEITKIECGHEHSMCIDIYGKLWVFGLNRSGQLGLSDNENRFEPVLHDFFDAVIDLSHGANSTFIKTIDNKIYAFGLNNKSQIGYKKVTDIEKTPVQVFIDNENIWSSNFGKSRAKSARK